MLFLEQEDGLLMEFSPGALLGSEKLLKQSGLVTWEAERPIPVMTGGVQAFDGNPSLVVEIDDFYGFYPSSSNICGAQSKMTNGGHRLYV